jgi:hypothetical protein
MVKNEGGFMANVKIERIKYGGWDNCIQITNGLVDLVVTTDVGPRIIRYGFVNQNNEMCEVKSQMGLTGGDEWRIYGGHRLWHGPESKPRTYEPDNNPVKWEQIPDGIRTMQDIEPWSKIKKEMEITLFPKSSRVRILHRLTNRGPWPIELSVWSISAMAKGGKEVIPQPSKDTGLLPNRIIAIWPYTRLNDPRLYLGEKYIILRQDPDITHPLKIGIANEDSWAAYFNNNHLFLKYYIHHPNARYPDFGVSYETYINDFMLEMETLSPLNMLKPDASITHIEIWELFDNVPMPSEEAEIQGIMEKVGPETCLHPCKP